MKRTEVASLSRKGGGLQKYYAAEKPWKVIPVGREAMMDMKTARAKGGETAMKDILQKEGAVIVTEEGTEKDLWWEQWKADCKRRQKESLILRPIREKLRRIGWKRGGRGLGQ